MSVVLPAYNRADTIAEGELRVLENACQVYARAGIELPRSVVRRRLNRVVAQLGRAHMDEGSHREARCCFGRALRLAPFRRKVWREYLDSLRRELRESPPETWTSSTPPGGA